MKLARSYPRSRSSCPWAALCWLLCLSQVVACSAHLTGFEAPSIGPDARYRSPLSGLEPPVLVRFLGAQMALQEVVAEKQEDTRAFRATELLQEAVSLAPRQASLWRYLASARASLLDLEGAVEAARRAVALDEGDPRGHYQLGLQLHRMGANREAELALELALELGLGSTGSELPHYWLYRIRSQRGDVDGALQVLARWRESSPASTDSQVLRTQLLWKSGRGHEASKAAAEALRAEPRSAEVLKILMESLLLDPLLAIWSLEEALKADWSALPLHRQLVASYRTLGRYDRALEHLRIMRNLSGWGPAVLVEDEIKLLLQMGRGEEALLLLENRFLAGTTIDPLSLRLLSWTYSVLGRPEEGLQRLAELAGLEPELSLQIEAERQLLTQPQGWRPAPVVLPAEEELLRQLAELEPVPLLKSSAGSGQAYRQRLERERQRINLQLQLAHRHLQQGERSSCERVLVELLALHPSQADGLNALAYLWAEDGRRLEEALKLQEQALEQRPFSGAYQDTMGWIHYRRGDLEQALSHLHRAADLLPFEPEILEHLAELLQSLGRAEEALEHQRRAARIREIRSPSVP